MKISSGIVGDLCQSDDFDDWWISKDVEIPMFDNLKLKFIFMDFDPILDKNFITDADNALKFFLKKGTGDRCEISNHLYDICKIYFNSYPEMPRKERGEFKKMLAYKNIWEFVKPVEVYLTYNESGIMFLDIHCECDWDEEHGLQIVYKEGNDLSKISEIDGHLEFGENESFDDIHYLANNPHKYEYVLRKKWWMFWK